MDENERKRREERHGDFPAGMFFGSFLIAGIMMQYVTHGKLFGQEPLVWWSALMSGLWRLAAAGIGVFAVLFIADKVFWVIDKGCGRVFGNILKIIIVLLFAWLAGGLF